MERHILKRHKFRKNYNTLPENIYLGNQFNNKDYLKQHFIYLKYIYLKRFEDHPNLIISQI